MACLKRPRLAGLIEHSPAVSMGDASTLMSSRRYVESALRGSVVTRHHHLVHRKLSHLLDRYRALPPDLPPSRPLSLDVGGLPSAAVVLPALAFAVAVLSGVPWLYALIVPFGIALAVTLVVVAAFGVLRLVVALTGANPWDVAGRWALTLALAPWGAALWLLTEAWARLWIKELHRNGLGEWAAQAVEELIGEEGGTLLAPDSHEGLRSPHKAGYVVAHGPAAELARKMDQLDGGTIAVSGPRGVGKTTLMRSSVHGRDFCVFSQAPATYAPHDFLADLFVQVCRKHLREQGYEVPQFVRLPHLHRALRRLARPLRRLFRGLCRALPAAALLTLGLFATVRTLGAEHGPGIGRRTAELTDEAMAFGHDLVSGREPEAALALTFAGLFLWVLRASRSASWLLGRGGRALSGLCVIALNVGPYLSLALDPDIRRHSVLLFDHGTALWFGPLIATWLWCLVQDDWSMPDVRIGPWQVPRERLFGPPVKVLPFVALALLAWGDSTRPLVTDSENPIRVCAPLAGALLGRALYRRRPLLRTEPELVTACRNHLYQLQTVQSSSAAVTSGATQLLTLGTQHTTSLSTVPPNYPALVADFRALLTKIAAEADERGRRVVIAIDEVDRLGTDAQALAFLGEIKAILGVPHVHYLISVAEDVGAAFVRRGLPHRDVTDSSLDDVVHVRPAVLDESAAILRKRAPGISDPYVLLAHALSGGLPRDLIRYGRRLLEVRQATSHIKLADIARSVILEELAHTLSGFRTLLAKQHWTPTTSVVLGSFRSLDSRLRTACACREQEVRQALEHFALAVPGARDSSPGTGAVAGPEPGTETLPGDARTLIDEAAAYAYFSLTLLDIFGGADFARRGTEAAERGADGDPELLAEARRELGVSPYSARALVDDIRQAWDLPSPPPTAGLVPRQAPPGSGHGRCRSPHGHHVL
ncbi:hypothetical protein CP975_25475 [Streptomyces alboniger]|uniref:KAP NTPase domain-containing protein n=2 Tax=Streptomyces alboniger TaxID=132473 RepID=A0A5J6HJC8_STRAD|nr:hypothetical protein CP975_25475 [Streptomyces alboniger]